MKAIIKEVGKIRIQITTVNRKGEYTGNKLSRNIMLYPEPEEITDENKLDEIEQKIRKVFE